MDEALLLTALEVAALADTDEAFIRSDVDLGAGSPSGYSFADLVYFRLLAVFGHNSTADERRCARIIVESMMNEESGPRPVARGWYSDDNVRMALAEMSERLNRFRTWKRKLVQDRNILGGETVYPGTRSSVRRIGGLLLRGVPQAEIREDYPHLHNEDFEFAPVFVMAYPRNEKPVEMPRALAS